MLKYSSMDGWIDIFMYLMDVLSCSSLMDGMYSEFILRFAFAQGLRIVGKGTLLLMLLSVR